MGDERSENLENLTVAELRERASELEITGRSSMNKDDLVTAVADAREQTAAMESRGTSAEKGKRSDWVPFTASEDSSSEAAKDDEDDEDEEASDDSSDDSASSGEIDASDIPAPSIGPNTTIDLKPPEERLDQDKISKVDAMGLDKRRQVQGKRYGASPLKQAVVYGSAVAVIIALFVGGKLLVDELDTTPPINDNAPWASGQGELQEPAPLDFPRSTNR